MGLHGNRATDGRHVEQRRAEAATRGRGGRGGRGGSYHLPNVGDTAGYPVVSSSRAMMVAPGIRPIHQTVHVPPSPYRNTDNEDTHHTQISQGSDLQEVIQPFESNSMDVDRELKGKKKICSSPPPLLISSLDQRPESSNDAHRRFVEKVKQVLSGNMVCTEQQHDPDSSDDDSGLEDSVDERTLWDFQKGIQKGSQARKGVQLLSSVQKKKIQKKKKGRGLSGGKGS